MIDEIIYGGFSASPDDYAAPDGDLAAVANLVPEDGALKPIFPPTEKFALNTGEQLLWIHKMTGHTHYILLHTSSDNPAVLTLKWVCEENGESDVDNWTRHTIGTISSTPTVNSIGNTLIVNDSTGVNYYLWTIVSGSQQYSALGQKPPMLNISFGLESDFAVWPDKKNGDDNGNNSRTDRYGITKYGGADIFVGKIKDGLLPKLGSSTTEGGAAWATPQPVMAANTGTGDMYDRIRDFAANQATYSVEDMDSGDDTERNDLSTIKNKLTTGVFARVNYFANKLGTEKNKFVAPFFVRYAYRLYDNSYIMHSYPVLMIPNSRGPVFGLDGQNGLMLADYDDNKTGFRVLGRVYGFIADLVYNIASIPSDLAKWKDVITSVDIAVSAPAYTYNQAGQVFGWTNMDGANAWDEYFSISKLKKIAGEDVNSPTWGIKAWTSAFEDLYTVADGGTEQPELLGPTYNVSDYFNRYYEGSYKYPSYIATVPQRTIAEINDDLTGDTAFYVIKKFTIDELSSDGNYHDLGLDKGTLIGLLSRQRINDEYRSHDVINASLMHGFNGRMNYAGITRFPHSPLSPAVQFAKAATTGTPAWQVTIELKNEMQTSVVQSSSVQLGDIDFPRFIYYPDTNAKFAYITKGTTNYKLKLTPHDHLNGAYWLANIMTQNVIGTLTSYSGTVPSATTTGVKEENKIYTTNVNNPFVVEAININTVGTGKILGISAAVKALSQGQFGQFPLYAFTDEGVWALETNAKGSYSARQPVTRDVCINPDSITQLDSSVLYASDRGIMMLAGATSTCISEALDSATGFAVSDLPSGSALLTLASFSSAQTSYAIFRDFIGACRMVYDYTNQRIVIYNPTYQSSAYVYKYAYVYSLKSNKWGIMTSDIIGGVNSYPEALAITSDAKVVNLSQPVTTTTTTVDGQTVTVPALVNALAVTRPLKLNPPHDLKTVDTIIQRGLFDYHGRTTTKPVRTILYGSRDLINWHLVSSSQDHYLRGFRGTPYRYFRIVAICNLKYGESINGATIQYEPRRNNQPR